MAQPTVAGAKETAAQFLDSEGLDRRLSENQAAEDARIAADLARAKTLLKRDDKAGAGLEALLKKEEAGSAKEIEQSKAFAIINAGLAMMAGGSPNALQNIAQGAMVGTKQYQEALKDFSKAAKERQKAFASIEEARRAEARDDAKAMLAAEQRASDAFAASRKFAIQGSIDLGVKRADIAGKAYDSAMAQYGATQRTGMEIDARAAEGAANRKVQREIDRTPTEVRLMEWLRDPENRKLFSEVQGIKQAPKTRQELMEQWSKNFMLQQKFPDFNDFVMVMSAASSSAPGSVPPPGAVKLKPGQ
jgi:hypothetical protein